MPETLIVTREDAIGIVQLNRPRVLNALNEQLLTELGVVLRELDDDATCRCIVIQLAERVAQFCEQLLVQRVQYTWTV